MVDHHYVTLCWLVELVKLLSMFCGETVSTWLQLNISPFSCQFFNIRMYYLKINIARFFVKMPF